MHKNVMDSDWIVARDSEVMAARGASMSKMGDLGKMVEVGKARVCLNIVSIVVSPKTMDGN